MNAKQIEIHVQELIRKYALAADNLTEKQFVEALRQALRQALACGDFTRFVTHDGTKQAVVYVPFFECEQLRTKIKKLEKEIKEAEGRIAELTLDHQTREE